MRERGGSWSKPAQKTENLPFDKTASNIGSLKTPISMTWAMGSLLVYPLISQLVEDLLLVSSQ
jgi:hypothetical protein